MKFSFSTAPQGVTIIFDKNISAHQYTPQKSGGELRIKIKDTKEKKYSLKELLVLIREVVQVAKVHQIRTLTLHWQEINTLQKSFKKEESILAGLVVENMILAGYAFSFYKTKDKKEKKSYTSVEKVNILLGNISAARKRDIQKEAQRAVIQGTYINWCRNLANTPGNDMTPTILAQEVKRAVTKEKNKNLKLKILDEREIRDLKMGGVLAVGKGSREASKFIILEYRGGKKGDPTIALVGKGVTFDSGGIDTKPSPHALEMMMDMSGGAAVLTATLIAAKVNLKKNIIALVPAVENMPSGESFRPGDVITMMDGTTVEIGHTDAEGRLILGDAISYAKRYKPGVLINVATLTGAASVALGERATGLFSQSDSLAEALLTAGEETGDVAWRLPLWDDYKSEIVGNVADISNVRTKGSGGVGGAITAATFVAHFAKDIPHFAHLDMAPTMTAVFDEQLAKGAKGSPIRLLLEAFKNL